MGEIVLAAKITHVPSIWLSEHSKKFKGIRQNAIDGLVEIVRAQDTEQRPEELGGMGNAARRDAPLDAR